MAMSCVAEAKAMRTVSAATAPTVGSVAWEARPKVSAARAS